MYLRITITLYIKIKFFGGMTLAHGDINLLYSDTEK